MPELAEVERGRRLLENAILGKIIATTSTQEDARVFVGESASLLEKSLPGRTVLAVNRIGKNIYLKLDGRGPTLAFHLGMTGSVAIKDGEFHYRRPRYIKRISKEWPPWRWKILLKMTDGTEVCTIDTSRFGRIRAIDAEDAASIPPLSLLARDAWLDLPSPEELRAELICRTAPIKTVLLDQNAAVSGLGNYNVDEVLFQARIHPRQPAYTLSTEQTIAIHAAIKLVAAMVMHVDADTTKLPKTWLYKHRYGRKSGIGQTFVMEDGSSTQVTHDRINGRITALTHVQVLSDYTDIPLPKRRKKTVVETEEDVADEDDIMKVSPDCDSRTKSKKRKKNPRSVEAEQKQQNTAEATDLTEARPPKVKRTKRAVKERAPAKTGDLEVNANVPTSKVRRSSARIREKNCIVH